MNRSNVIHALWMTAAAAMLLLAAVLQQDLSARADRDELVPKESEASGSTALLAVPAGFRAPMVTLLWIRADKLHQEGRYYDAMTLADMICQLMPRFPGVWGFHAWNMAWNISVTTHTPEERWRWVEQGIRLLRDKGIQINPESIVLYRELGWIYFSKMGQNMDDMHWHYKRQWAAKMHRVLGNPPFADTPAVIEWFRPIAQAPLDRNTPGDGAITVQGDVYRRQMLSDPAVAEYVGLLAALDISIERGDLLDAYNRWTTDSSVAITRAFQPSPATEREKAVWALINDSAHAPARNRLLAFVRAQTLWNTYKMDPAWMLTLMERHGPLDWRQVWSHAIYWTTIGFERTGATLETVDPLNNERVLLNSLKLLTWQGQLIYRENPQEPEQPFIQLTADVRFIAPAQREFLNVIAQMEREDVNRGVEVRAFKHNAMNAGHINYLTSAIEMLYAGGRESQAQQLWDWLRTRYALDDPEYKLQDVGDFVVASINKVQAPVHNQAITQVSAAIQAALLDLMQGDNQGFNDRMLYVRLVYNKYHEIAVQRTQLPDVLDMMANLASLMLVSPEMLYMELSMDQRMDLYRALDDNLRLMIYDVVEPLLRPQFQAQRPGESFEAAFPPPPGLDEARRQRQVNPLLGP